MTQGAQLPLEQVYELALKAEREGRFSDAEGFYRLSGLHAGAARFVLSKAGYEDRVVEMMIEADSQLDAQLVREP